MQWKTNVENLVRVGQLKAADRDDEIVAQYVRDASGYHSDALAAQHAPSKFLLAYEGIHALSMAVLNHLAVRVDSGEGHRQTALQVALMAVGIDDARPGASRLVMTFHKVRNQKTYQSPIPSVSMTNAVLAIESLDLMLDATATFAGIERPVGEKR